MYSASGGENWDCVFRSRYLSNATLRNYFINLYNVPLLLLLFNNATTWFLLTIVLRFNLNSHTYIKPIEMIRFYINTRKKSLNLEYESSQLVQQNAHQMSHIYVVRKTKYFCHYDYIKHIMCKLNQIWPSSN